MPQTPTPSFQPSDIDLCISALHALKVINAYYASSEDASRLAKEIVTTLGGVNDPGYQAPPLKLAIAQAIYRTYVGALPTTPAA